MTGPLPLPFLGDKVFKLFVFLLILNYYLHNNFIYGVPNMARFLFLFLFLGLPAAFSQEMTVSSNDKLQVANQQILSGQLKSYLNGALSNMQTQLDAANAEIQAMKNCEQKKMFYSPSNSSADSDGCIQRTITYSTTPKSCAMNSFDPIPNTTAPGSFCAITGRDHDYAAIINTWQCVVRPNYSNNTWEYRFAAGCGQIVCQAMCITEN